MKPKLIISSCRHGLIRGGVAHPSIATHELHTFTDDQLKQIVADSNLTVAVGHLVAADNLDDFLANRASPAHAAKPASEPVDREIVEAAKSEIGTEDDAATKTGKKAARPS